MSAGNVSKLEQRVVRAAEAALAERKFVTAIDVLVGVGRLEPRQVDEWRQGRVRYLERVVSTCGHGLDRGLPSLAGLSIPGASYRRPGRNRIRPPRPHLQSANKHLDQPT